MFFMIWPQVRLIISLDVFSLSFKSQTRGCSCHSRLLRLSINTPDRISRFLLLIGKIDPISSCYLSSRMSVIWVLPPLSVQTGNTVWHDYIKLTQSSRNSLEKRVEIYELHNHLHTHTHRPSVTSPLLFFSLPLSFLNSLEVFSYLMRLVPPTACVAAFL